MTPIKILIDVTQVDKARIFPSKDGKKKYLALVGWPNKHGADEWGNTHYVKQQQDKDDKSQSPIIGNMKVPQDERSAQRASTPQPRAAAPDLANDDVPF